MKNLFTIVAIIVLIVKVLSVCFDSASNEVRNQAEQRLDRIEQVAK